MPAVREPVKTRRKVRARAPNWRGAFSSGPRRSTRCRGASWPTASAPIERRSYSPFRAFPGGDESKVIGLGILARSGL
jgi:hypothetical protein